LILLLRLTYRMHRQLLQIPNHNMRHYNNKLKVHRYHSVEILLGVSISSGKFSLPVMVISDSIQKFCLNWCNSEESNPSYIAKLPAVGRGLTNLSTSFNSSD